MLTPWCSEWARPNTSPNAYELASVTAAAPMIAAFSSAIANRSPAARPSVCASPLATVPASPNCPASRVPPNANAAATISAAAPRITTTEPITVSARS